MLKQIRTATVLLIALTILTGGVYPLAVTAIGQVVFPIQANGSVLRDGERPVGSELIGQSFSKPEHFWGRPSATAPMPYNAAASSGSNFGPLHPDLKKAVENRTAELAGEATHVEIIPVDLVTSSGSGLDPHISPAAAEFQVPRIAASRRMSEADVRKLVGQYTAGRQLGILGEPRVNVLRLNIALDQQQNRQ